LRYSFEIGECYGYKEKRKIVIYVSMAAGLGMPLLALFFSLIETLFIDFSQNTNFISDYSFLFFNLF